MDTKSAAPISTAFPTCGEVFYFLVTALDLPTWVDSFDAIDPDKAKQRNKDRAKQVSDQLRDWATEAGGRAPARSEFVDFVREHTKRLPNGNAVGFVLTSLWDRVLAAHAEIVRENATILGREGTRGWCARLQAPSYIYFLYALQKLLQRSARCGGPCLATPIDKQLTRVWDDEPHSHPLLADCYAHYAREISEEDHGIDPKMTNAWRSGEDRPSFESLGRAFRNYPQLYEVVLNFGFAELLEKLAKTFRNHVAESDWPDCRELLILQARCLRRLDGFLAKEAATTASYSLTDYEGYLFEHLGAYQRSLATVLSQGDVATLDVRLADLRVYQKYDERFAPVQFPPGFRAFMPKFDALWKATRLSAPACSVMEAQAILAALRRDHAEWCEALSGPLVAIGARLALAGGDKISAESVQRAWELYQSAVDQSRYRAGTYTQRVMREGLGLAAMLHRRGVGEGSIKPWIKQVLGWWDLLGMGDDFDHEQEAQRIERAESRFTDGLHVDLRKRLRDAFPTLGLLHWNINGLMGFAEGDHIEKLQSIPVDKRQKKPMNDTGVGREQTPLMEAIDRGQLDLARELVGKGADLNFINSTGDTCVTKAFARRYYDLVLEILRRGDAPVRRATLLRVTDKLLLSGLEEAIAHGRLDILRELALWKPGRGDTIDLDVERINGVTPLFYAVACLGCFRMSTEEFERAAPQLLPNTKAIAPFHANLTEDADGLRIFDATRKRFAKEENPQGILECIDYMIHGLDVNLDAPNTNDNSVLTLAAERRMHDVAAKLLACGASVNHRLRGGVTALTWAILNNDYDMVKLLLEYRADYRLFVDAFDRPIYALEMSEKLRQLIPQRP